MFIGTADDRYLRPHAFYQVHRITGKTVATASQEILVSCTKVLEIPLLPENNMSARYVSEAELNWVYHHEGSSPHELFFNILFTILQGSAKSYNFSHFIKKNAFCRSIGFQFLFLIIMHIFKLFFNSSFPQSVSILSELWPVLSFPFHLCLSVSYMWLLKCMRPRYFSSLLRSIDCAGILKLRNSDIELRKGETDIGRKNTRVRVVFRVHIPQPNGKVLSLQAASVPVECCECLTHTHKHMHSHILANTFCNCLWDVNLWVHCI